MRKIAGFNPDKIYEPGDNYFSRKCATVRKKGFQYPFELFKFDENISGGNYDPVEETRLVAICASHIYK